MTISVHFRPFSVIFGQFLVNFWSIFGQFLVQYRSKVDCFWPLGVTFDRSGHIWPLIFHVPWFIFFFKFRLERQFHAFDFKIRNPSFSLLFYKVLWHHRLLGPLGLNHFRPLLLWDASLYYDRKNLKCLPESLRHTKSTICLLQKVYI